jgi:two-component system response regulator QseB
MGLKRWEFCMRVLVVEDQERIAKHISDALTKGGFAVDSALNLDEANEAMRAAVFDLVLLDLGLPDGDGVDWLRKFRASGHQTPVLIITARGALGDRVKGLDAGADDYLLKPFAIEEVLARCRALLRRPTGSGLTLLQSGGIALDLASRSVRVNGKPADLGRREVNLLELLLRKAGSVVTRETIDSQMYSFDDEVTPNAIEAGISRLRHKLGEAGSTATIHTVRGVGYLLSAD